MYLFQSNRLTLFFLQLNVYSYCNEVRMNLWLYHNNNYKSKVTSKRSNVSKMWNELAVLMVTEEYLSSIKFINRKNGGFLF